MEKKRQELNQKLAVNQRKFEDLKNLQPAQMANNIQRDLENNIKVKELELDLRSKAIHEQPKVEEEKKRINMFEEEMAAADRGAYFKKLEEIKQQEREKKDLEDFQTFKQAFVAQATLRTVPPEQLSNDKFYKRIKEYYMPISKERNRALLEELDQGLKDVDPKVENQPFEELFAGYWDKYYNFTSNMLDYHQQRLYQAKLLTEIEALTKIASKAPEITEKKVFNKSKLDPETSKMVTDIYNKKMKLLKNE